ncbi:hypothetical protein niasHT_002462 [Heterodera trifolii]|uniref:B30.2/SPRY domain-containing protein n=1 Tax=Heterodera trifolii TaxID=157864 RepID=A0ABD2LPZ5_9BILA
MTKFIILTVVNITVTVGLLGFITIENGRTNAELEILKNSVGKLEQHGKDGQQTEVYAKINAEKDMVKSIKAKVIALEEHQKKEAIFIGVLKDRFGKELLKAVHPDIRKNIAENFSNPKQNCWDVNAIHHDLEIFGSESLKVHYKGDGSGHRSVFAKHPILFTESGIFYFEIKIKSCKSLCSIGFATKAMPLDENVGQNSDSCAYQSDGQFWTNGSKNFGIPNFSRGDFVGCGINLATRRIIFTKNGQPLNTSNLFLSPPFGFPLFPFISLNDSGDLIETNFGPQFKFDPAKKAFQEELEKKVTEQIVAVQTKVDKMEMAHQQQKELHGNCWDAFYCDKNIEISGDKSLIVHHTGIYNGWRSVFAKYPIVLNKHLSDFFYYEISILRHNKYFLLIFGFAVKQQTKLELFLNEKGTYAWEINGEIWISGERKGRNDQYSYGEGDTVGIGVNSATRKIIFTQNGQRLDTSDFLFDPSFADRLFYPFVSLCAFDDKIEANFGPNFKFDLATL